MSATAAEWQVERVACSDANGGVSIQGVNHAARGEAFWWTIGHHGLVWSYRERYGRFRGARFEPGARKRLAMLLRMARRDCVAGCSGGA